MRSVLLSVFLILAIGVAGTASHAAASSGANSQNVTGTVKDAIGRPLAKVTVKLQAADGHALNQTTTNASGEFSFPDVPLGTYAIVAEKNAFKTATSVVTVAGGGVAPVELALESSAAIDLAVTAKRLDKARNGLSPETGSSTYRFSSQALSQLPQSENTPLNQVLLQAPGTVQDSFGQVHIRGDHANIQYRINGIELPEGLSGFGQALSPRFANNINLITGALPAQYGFRTAGIVDINTKNGAIETGGSVQMYGGQRATYEPNFELGGTAGGLSYFATGSYLATNRGIEPPTAGPTAIHDHSNQGTGFLYLSYLLNPTTRLGLISGVNINGFQIPANPNAQPTSCPDADGNPQLCMVDDQPPPTGRQIAESQFEQTYYNVLALQGSLGTQLDYQVAAFSRYSSIAFTPDFVGDLAFNGSSSNVYRRSFANGLQSDNAYRLPYENTLRGGFYLSGEPVTINNHEYVFPANDMGMQTSNTPMLIVDDKNKTAWLYGMYVQDEWRPLEPLTINAGIRYDLVDAFTHSDQFSPRLGAVYDFPTQTILHAGYSRYFTPPPSELVDATDVQKFDGTTGALPSQGVNFTARSSRANYFDVGAIQGLVPGASIGVDSYYQQTNYILDEGQFGSALVFTPFNYRYGKQYGVEVTGSYNAGNFNSYLNFAYSVAKGKRVITGQFNFDPDELAYIQNHFVHLDHDQTFSGSGGMSYGWMGIVGRLDLLWGSGLRSGFANTDSLPYYVQVNTGVSKRFDVPYLGWAEVRVDCINLFDSTYQIRNGTGIGVASTQYGPRRAVYAGIRVPLPFMEPTVGG